MMKYPLIFFLLLASLPLFAQIPERDADTCWTAVKKPKDVYRRVVLYRPGDHSSKNYRIPAIVTAGDGSLVAACDKRKYNDADLPEDIDILINRSMDGGRTWRDSTSAWPELETPACNGDILRCTAPDGTIGLYVEEACNDGVNYSMVFYNFSVEWLLETTGK